MKPSPIWKLLQVFCRVVTTLLFDLKVYGSHRFPREGGVLLVSNHQSYLDPLLLGVRLPRTLSYMAKASLFKIAPFAWFIRSLGAFPVRQGEGDIRERKRGQCALHRHVITAISLRHEIDGAYGDTSSADDRLTVEDRCVVGDRPCGLGSDHHRVLARPVRPRSV